jgi:Tol biopolymer transport system component
MMEMSARMAGFALVLAGPAWAQVTTRSSVAADGAEGDGGSFYSQISANGRFVVFYGDSDNLVGGDSNNQADVFIRDRALGTTQRVNLSSSGSQANFSSGATQGIAISADGRFVAFETDATNLVPGDTNGFRDVLVRDRQSGTTERVSPDLLT